VKVPPSTIPQKIVEKTRWNNHQKIVAKPVEKITIPRRVEKTVHVPQIVEKIVEVPKEKIVEKIVEVPKEKIVYRDRIVEVPKEKIVYRDRIVYKEEEEEVSLLCDMSVDVPRFSTY
jgi:hypothetical protein